jgi:hypothetical protein
VEKEGSFYGDMKSPKLETHFLNSANSWKSGQLKAILCPYFCAIEHFAFSSEDTRSPSASSADLLGVHQRSVGRTRWTQNTLSTPLTVGSGLCFAPLQGTRRQSCLYETQVDWAMA